MNNNNFDLVCYNFQKKIINVFNEQENIPFQLKFYLFKDIWKIIKETKARKDYETKVLDSQKNQTLTKQIVLPEEFLQENKKEEE